MIPETNSQITMSCTFSPGSPAMVLPRRVAHMVQRMNVTNSIAPNP